MKLKKLRLKEKEPDQVVYHESKKEKKRRENLHDLLLVKLVLFSFFLGGKIKNLPTETEMFEK